jgi:hypothetical protein
MMPLHGAKELTFPRFSGGLVRTLDPTELDPDQAYRALNVDFRDYALTKRLGKKPYNSSTPSGMTAEKVRGIFAYYSQDGGSRKLLLAVGAKVLGDTDANGSFDLEVATGLAGSGMTDFMQLREDLFFGNGYNAVQKWSGSGSAAAVALLTEPAAPGLAAYRPVLDSFDYTSSPSIGTAFGATWARTDNTITIDRDTEEQLEGLSALSVTFASGSKGDSIQKRYAYAARVDLSHAKNLLVYYQCTRANVSFQVGIIPNDYGATLAGTMTSGTATCNVSDSYGMEVGDYLRIEAEIVRITAISTNQLTVDRAQFGTTAAAHNTLSVAVSQAVNWDQFETFYSAQGSIWIPLRISLAKVTPARRTGSLGFGIRLNTTSTFPVTFKFDQLQAEGVLTPDEYRYYATYGDTDRISDYDVLIRESNPSVLATVQLDELPPAYGVKVTPAVSGDATVSVIRIYRHRANGPFRKARLVGTAPNAATTLGAAVTDSPRLQETWTLASVVGISRGSVLLCGSEKVLVRDVDQDAGTVQVARGFDGTTAATHSSGAAVSWAFHFDAKSDGALTLEAAEELVTGKIAPPIAKTYALANGRMVAGNVYLGGTWYPDRLYLSRLGFVEEFSTTQEPQKGAGEPGWVRIPTHDQIVRIVEHDGELLIFCDRSVWVLEGSGWDDFTLRRRAAFGLDGREAVTVSGRLIWLLARDGVRVLAPNSGNVGLFESWIVSEPVGDLLRTMTAAERAAAAFGVDERGRILLSLEADSVLVFDPELGDLSPQSNPKRRGWTLYGTSAVSGAPSWGASCYHALKRGGGDAGQLLAGDLAQGVVWYLHRDGSDAEILTDYATNGAGTLTAKAITWEWQGRTEDGGVGAKLEWCHVSVEADAATGETVDATPVLDGTDYGSSYSLSLTSAKAFAAPLRRCAADVRGRFAALLLSSPAAGHTGAIRIRSARAAFYLRG